MNEQKFNKGYFAVDMKRTGIIGEHCTFYRVLAVTDEKERRVILCAVGGNGKKYAPRVYYRKIHTNLNGTEYCYLREKKYQGLIVPYNKKRG